MNRLDEAAEFERWLDRELPRAIAGELGATASPPPLAIPSRSHGRRAALRVGGVAAAVVATLGVIALATGTPDPVSLGHKVVHVVSVGSVVLQRTPVPTPAAPPGRPATAPAGSDPQPEPTADGSGDANAGRSDGSTDKTKPAHGDGSPPPELDHTPKGHGHQ